MKTNVDNRFLIFKTIVPFSSLPPLEKYRRPLEKETS